MKLEDYDTSRRHTATVVSSERISPESSPDEIREILLDVEEPGFAVAPGQSIGVLAPAPRNTGAEHHFRLYTVADIPERREHDHLRFPLCVKRCTYIDDYSGERFKGVASNFLCDLRPGDSLTVTGPYGLAFEVPDDPEAALILIGAGTGIAPFRAFVKHLYHEATDFKGRVILFHGATSGLDLLYMNETVNDFALYYDRDTFEAVTALSQRPHWSEAIDWRGVIESRGEELWNLLSSPHTRVYLAGLKQIRDELDAIFSQIAGSEEKWARRKAELEAGHRWVELLY